MDPNQKEQLKVAHELERLQLQAFASLGDAPSALANFLVEAPAPYIFRVDYARSEIERIIQLVWQQVSEEDAKLLRATYSNDKVSLFAPLLNELCLRALSKRLWPREPIFTTDFGVLQAEPDKYTLSCQVYLAPEGTLKNFSEPIKVTGISPVNPQAVDAEVRERLQAIRHAHSEERDRPGGLTEDGDMLYLKVESKIDGASWGPGQLPPTRVLWTKEKVLEELYFALLGKGVGNHKIAFTLSEKFGELAGKLIEADVSVFSVMTFVLPDMTDEFAQRLGKSSMADFELEVRREVEQRHKDRYKEALAEAALSVLVEHVEHGPFPTQWLKSQAEDRYRSLLAQCKSSELLYKQLGVSTDDEAMLQIYAAIKKQASTVVALVAYGRLKGFERGPEESIGNMSGYLNKVLDCLLSETQVL